MRFVQQLVTLKSSILQWALHMQLTSFTRSLTHARGFHLEKSLRIKREHTNLKPEEKKQGWAERSVPADASLHAHARGQNS